MRSAVWASVAATIQLAAASSAQAGLVLTYEELGGNVVVTGAGTINLAALTFNSTMHLNPGVSATGRYFMSGSSGNIDFYGGTTGPTSFGGGGLFNASSGTGDLLGISVGFVAVPEDYVSGTALSGTAMFNNASFQSLGLNVGTYAFTWGTAQTADFLTVQIGPRAAELPEPASVGLVGMSMLLGMWVSRRRLHRLASTTARATRLAPAG